MKLRFQADADLNQRIVAGVQRLEPTIDFRTAGQANLEGKADPEVLGLSAEGGRILVTHDQKTIPHHFAAFVSQHTSPGVIIVPQDMPIGQAVQELLLAWSAVNLKSGRTLFDGCHCDAIAAEFSRRISCCFSSI